METRWRLCARQRPLCQWTNNGCCQVFSNHLQKKKKLLQLQRSNFVAMQHQADMTFEWSLEKASALRQSKKRQPIWSVSESCAQSKIKWTVKSPSKVLPGEVKCIMWKVLCACILTSLAVSGASALIPLLLLRGSEGRITPSSKSLFHLYPITPSSGGGRGGRAAQADRTGFLYIPLLPCSSFSFLFPVPVSRAWLALFDLKTFPNLFHCSFLSSPPHHHHHFIHLHLLCSPLFTPPLPLF